MRANVSLRVVDALVEELSLREGERLDLVCRLSGYVADATTVKWTRNGEDIDDKV